MLKSIRIKDFALIPECEVLFGPGLNVVSGESGAGKSLLLQAIDYLFGGRPNPSLIREGASQCEVEGEFILKDKKPEQPLKSGDNIIRRRSTSAGRSSATLNGSPISIADLRRIGGRILDFSEQFESQVLKSPATHTGILDSFGDERHREALSEMRRGYEEHKQAQQRLESYQRRRENLNGELDFLDYCITEIEGAKLREGEEEELTAVRDLMTNRARIKELSDALVTILYEGVEGKESAYDLLTRAERLIDQLPPEVIKATAGGRLPSALSELRGITDDTRKRLEEISRDLSNVSDELDQSGADIDEVHSRLETISRLKSKYGKDIREIRERLETMRGEKVSLENIQETLSELQAEIARRRKEVIEKGKRVTEGRMRIAKVVEKRMNEVLSHLAFEKPRFIVGLVPEGDEENGAFSANGLESVEFFVGLNPGETARPLADTASGGESSRLLLAIKAILNEKVGFSTVIFDEIEAGLGAESAKRVGEMMFSIAKRAQVIAITHIAQVAAIGERHIIVDKGITGGRSEIGFREVSGKERVGELARMIGGAEDKDALRLAKRLLEEGT